jgi:3-dehydroquinate dehydratase/shikimate dehydrogenase
MQNAVEQGGFAYAELEDDLAQGGLEAACRRHGLRVIRSFHDLKGVPAGLEARLRRNRRRPDDLPAAEVTPSSAADLAGMIKTYRSLEGMQKILLGRGPYGLPTRILAPVLGSFLTLAEPGVVEPAELAGLYRYGRLGPTSSLYGVVGNPIRHSRSPHIHNAGLEAAGLDAVYLPFLADDAGAFLDCAESLGLRGISVTVPFKEKVLPFLAEADETVRAVGSCNTIVKTGRGWSGSNTDVAGFMAPLEALYGRSGLAGLACLVLGAGGAARAVVYGLARAGCRPLILNRTPERAHRLAREIEAALGLSTGALAAAGRDAAGLAAAERYRGLVVQNSPAGMSPNAGEDAFPEFEWSGRETAYDLVYNPRETVFLRRAAAAGCRVISGELMLLEQAYAQFKLYTGVEFPRERLEARLLKLF